MEEALKYETTDGIAVLTLNRPKAFNAFSPDLVTPLRDRLTVITTDPDITGVLITGAGKAFCAGGDLKWLSEYGKTRAEAFHHLAGIYHQAILEIRGMPKPVVAAINGLAAGGGFTLALACDFRVMEASGTLLQGYTSNGLSMDGGGTYMLPRLVGLARAMEIAVFDHPITSKQALSWGLVTKVVEDGTAFENALDMIRDINMRPMSSFRASKKLMGESLQSSLEEALEKEREYLAYCAEHDNGKEGMAAFLEKRRPVFNRRS